MGKMYIAFYVLSAVSLGFVFYFFYMAKDKFKKFVIKKSIDKEDNEKGAGVTFTRNGARLRGPNTIISDYNFSDTINTINIFITSFNKTNRGVNIASGILSFVAFAGYLISAIILS